MFRKIGIAEFRNHLKTYMEDVINQRIHVYQIGSDKDVLLMSPATLEMLQKRHYMNVWAKNQFCALKFDQYLTLVNGKSTKDLPLDEILALSEFFGLMTELLDILSRPGAKENASKWDVSQYIEPAVLKNPLNVHGRFDGIYMITAHLFHAEFFQGKSYTLLTFFKRVKRGLEENEQAILKTDGLSEEQITMIQEILVILSEWAIALITFQTLNTGDTKHPEVICLQVSQIIKWYENYIGELPVTLGYNPDMKIM